MTSRSREAVQRVAGILESKIKDERIWLENKYEFRDKLIQGLEETSREISGMKQDLEGLDLCPDSRDIIRKQISLSEDSLRETTKSLLVSEEAIETSKTELQELIDRHSRLIRDLSTQ